MTRLVCSVVTCLAVTLAFAATARAQDFEAAGKHFSAAQEAFGAKHFKTAATEFEAAYTITKDPVLLYNIGESWEKAGDGHKAVANYKAYLSQQPNAQDRSEVQRRISAIEARHYRLIDQSASEPAPSKAPTTAPATPPATTAPATPPVTTPTTPPPLKEPGTATAPPSTSATPPSAAPTTPPSTAPTTTETTPTNTPPAVAPSPQATTPAPEPATTAAPPPAATEPPPGLLEEGPTSKLRVAAWIGVAVTLATLTAGGIFGLAAESRADEINRRLSFVDMTGQPHTFDQSAANDLQSLRHDGHLYNGLAIGFYSVAGAAAIATVTMFIVDAKRKPEKKQAWHLAPVVGKDAGGFALGGSF